MREILFRGKRIDNGKWIEGAFLNDRGGAFYICPSVSDITYGDNGNRRRIGCWYKVDPSTVGQFTGLYDKNGKKVFEGDIVVCSQEINGNWIDFHIETGFVEMKHGAFGLHRKQGYYRPFKDWLENYEYEVIGNIHDNKELLEG